MRFEKVHGSIFNKTFLRFHCFLKYYQDLGTDKIKKLKKAFISTEERKSCSRVLQSVGAAWKTALVLKSFTVSHIQFEHADDTYGNQNEFLQHLMEYLYSKYQIYMGRGEYFQRTMTSTLGYSINTCFM